MCDTAGAMPPPPPRRRPSLPQREFPSHALPSSPYSIRLTMRPEDSGLGGRRFWS